jgi:protein TonB
MEAKKNPSKDIHRLSGMFFQIGLGVSITIVIVVFEWTKEFQKPRLRFTGEAIPDLVYIPVTNPVEPPMPSPIKSEIIPTSTKIPNTMVELASSLTIETDNIPIIDTDGIPGIPDFTVEFDSSEKYNRVWNIVEKSAEPVGGYPAFYELLRKNMKYPNKARQFNVEGKVFVEFIINKDGTPVDFKTIRGLGYGCDEEAIRVISLSKWKPGQQRGNSVRVKMVLPITFQLK